MSKRLRLAFWLAPIGVIWAIFLAWHDARIQYEPYCFDGHRYFDGPLDPTFVGIFVEVSYRLRGGAGFQWDGELFIEDRRIYFNRYGVDADLPLNATHKSLRYLVERRIAAGLALPQFALEWHDLVNRPVSLRTAQTDAKEDETFCSVLQWIALGRTPEEIAR